MRKMMLPVFLVLFGRAVFGQSPLPAIDVTAADVKAFIKQLPPDAVSDRPIRVVDVGGWRLAIYGVLRPKNVRGDAVLHETKVTEVYQILEGGGTLVTGGTLVDRGKASGGSISTVRGSRIEGGVSRHVGPGDFIIIPGRTPHWWSKLDADLTYVIIRPDPDGTLQLK